MKNYPLELDAKQIVRWLIEEQTSGVTKFRITARRSREVEELPTEGRFRLGDAEREDLSEAVTMATLVIEPFHAADGWRLSISVEDELGSRISVGDETEQEIDLVAFYEQFIRPGHGTADVVAEVEDAAAQSRLSPLLNDIEENRHDTNQKASRE